MQTTTNSVNPVPPVDWEQLDMIADGFDPEFVAIYHEFAAEIPVLLADTRRHIEAGNTEGVSRAAHQLKGTSANFGFLALYKATGDLETDARAGSLDRAYSLTDEAERAFEAAIAEVRERSGV